MRKTDFVSDREWNFDVPNDDATLQEKIGHQKRLQLAWQVVAEQPWRAIEIPLEDSDRMVTGVIAQSGTLKLPGR
jgi:hypothetical protein